jgi:ABC-type transporter Mla MlaB component
VFSVDSESYSKSWVELKALGLNAIRQGETVIDVSAWNEASSAHLAVMVYWWQAAKKTDRSITVAGLNPTFKTLAELGGVTCIETGEPDAGH